MSGPLQQKRLKDLGRSYAVKAIDLIYGACTDMVLGYGLTLVFLLGIGLAVSGDLVSVPVMHPG